MRVKLFVCLCAVVLLATAGGAQEFRGTLGGRITDQLNAVVPNVKIALVDKDTGARFETVSSADGQYTIPFVPPSVYELSAEAAGFKRYVRENVRVSTNERVALDISLELGGVAETVTVTAEQSLLETATASTGQVINARQIDNMPMNGRAPLVLAQLAFGVIPNSDPKFNRPFDNAGPSGFSMGGAAAQTNELLLDGSPDTTGNLRVAYNPPVDAVDEVKVETFQTDAAYGHTGGGTVNVVLKGGTNSFHGSVYDFNQVSALAAAQFFSNKAGLKKPVTRYNQYGFNLGGPVMVPKLLNGRNKVFFFFAWEGIRDSFPEPLTKTVPTEAERRGDFSALLKAGSNYQIYNPYTGVQQGSRIARQTFLNNIIPDPLLNPIAKAYLQYVPLPNQPGAIDGNSNYLANSIRRDTYGSEFGRLDFNLSERHKFFFDFRHNDRVENRNNAYNNIATGNFLSRVNWGTMLDDVYTFSPTVLLNTRLNWTRFIEGNVKPSDGFDFTTLGFPASVAAVAPHKVLPKINLNSSSTPFSNIGDYDAGDRTPFDIFQVFSSVTKVAGKHSLKFGGDVRMYRESSVSYGFSSGSYQFRTEWTRGPLDNSTGSPLGQEFAAFLLGLPTLSSSDSVLQLNAARTNQAPYYALFVQDDFRFRSNLTLNLGLRYERDLPTRERYNRANAGFDFTTASPVNALASAAYDKNPIAEIPVGQFRSLGGMLFGGPDHRDLYSTHAHYFSPRLGFAWQPSRWANKMVVRGGFGIFITPIGTTGVNNSNNGFSQTNQVVSTLDSYLTPAATLSNPFPNGIQQPTGSTLGLGTFMGQNVRLGNPDRLNPYATRWNLDLQRELPGNMVFEVGYVGNHALHLTVDHQYDGTPARYLSTSPTRDQATINSLTANVRNPYAGLLPGSGLNGTTTSRSQLLRPFPQFTQVRIDGINDGSSYFHMLQTRLEKRFSHGFQLLANYEYSKLIERTRMLNDTDLSPEKRISPDDRPQRFVFSGSWELPFGRGKAFGANAHPVLNKMIGGWVVNTIYTIQPGEPLNWESNNGIIYLGGDLNMQARNIDHAFDTTRFNTVSSQQLANNIRFFPSRFGALRQDHTNNVDFSAIKNTGITERIKIQFRCEFFNFFNRARFSAPDRTPTSSTFGKITGQDNLNRVVQMALRLVW